MKRKRSSVAGEGTSANATALALAAPPRPRRPAIYCRGSFDRVMRKLVSNFDESNLQNFRASCFGNFLKGRKIVFQGPVMHFLLRHLDPSSRGEGILRFNFNGVEAIFGRDEYACLTALQFGPIPAIPFTSNLLQAVFVGSTCVYTRDIEDAFAKECVEGGGGDLAFKLGLNLFVYGVLFGYGFIEHRIDTRLFNVAEDITSFNSFPWGSLSYDFLVSKFFDSYDRMMVQVGRGRNVSVDVYGFSLALQAWAFEIFPDLGNVCSYLIRQSSPNPSRLLWWYCPSRLTYDEFERQFEHKLPLKMEKFLFLDQGDDILTGPDAVCIENPLSTPATGVRRKLQYFICDDENNVMDAGKGNEQHGRIGAEDDVIVQTPSGSSSLTDIRNPLSLSNPIENLTIEAVDKRKSKGKAVCEDVCAAYMDGDMWCEDFAGMFPSIGTNFPYLSSDFGENQEVVNGNEDVVPWRPSVASDVAAVTNQFDELSAIFGGRANVQAPSLTPEPRIIESNIPNPIFADGESSKVQKVEWFDSDDDEWIDGVINDALLYSSNSEDSTTDTEDAACVDDLTRLVIEEPRRYNPVKRYPPKRMKPFRAWYRKAKNDDGPQFFRTPLKASQFVSLDWIRKLYKPREMLDDEHCDVLINLLIFKFERAPELFIPNWTCVEFPFWERCANNDLEHALKVCVRYVKGELPKQGGLRWCDVLQVFGIGHVGGNHWVAYSINMLSESIIVYDSLAPFNDWDSIRAQFSGLSTFIPALLKKASETDPDFGRWTSSEPWEVIPSESPPAKQSQENECGIMAMKNIECLASGTPIRDIDPEACRKYRRYYAGELFNAGNHEAGI